MDTIEYINARLYEAEQADRRDCGENVEPDPAEMAVVLESL